MILKNDCVMSHISIIYFASAIILINYYLNIYYYLWILNFLNKKYKTNIKL